MVCSFLCYPFFWCYYTKIYKKCADLKKRDFHNFFEKKDSMRFTFFYLNPNPESQFEILIRITGNKRLKIEMDWRIWIHLRTIISPIPLSLLLLAGLL